MIQYPRYKRHRFSSFQVIIAGFAAVDLVGALLLMFPIATQQRCVTPFHEALFTSTSALCVTGLVVQDTGSYWSVFGQSVILLLIQIGGLGVITVGAAFALLSGRKISLKQRSTMQEATAAPQMGGIVRLTGFILRITALFELVGAALLLPTFCADYGLRGIWYALFHSISAFCNAGFDLLGTEGAKFVSLTQYADDPLLTTVIAALIVFGGLGFLTWEDICTYRLDFHHYRMQSKVILVTTAFLLVLPSLYFYCFEFTAGSARQRILLSMFQSVTPRTAGFNTADLAAMGQPIPGIDGGSDAVGRFARLYGRRHENHNICRSAGQYVGDLPPQRRCRIFRAARGWFCGQECCHNCRNVFDTVLPRSLCHCYGRAAADVGLFV